MSTSVSSVILFGYFCTNKFSFSHSVISGAEQSFTFSLLIKSFFFLIPTWGDRLKNKTRSGTGTDLRTDTTFRNFLFSFHLPQKSPRLNSSAR